MDGTLFDAELRGRGLGGEAFDRDAAVACIYDGLAIFVVVKELELRDRGTQVGSRAAV